MNNEILIINTGGTFNKVYDEISGELIVSQNNNAINKILQTSKILDIKIFGLIHKDSLEINKDDIKQLVKYIKKSKYDKIIIVHGTDTINKTALCLANNLKNKKIVMTGAMKPFSINPIEATSNLISAVGFLKACQKNNVYICMHGLIKKHTQIIKNKKLGIFECQ